MKQNVFTIDAHFLYPGNAAIYAYQLSPNQIIIVDTNTNHAIPRIIDTFDKHNLSLDAVSHILITHIHLDHCGGLYQLSQKCKNAKIIVHPRAIRHLLDPSRLIAASQEIYGEQEYQAMFGSIQPIAENKIIEATDNYSLNTDRGQIIFLHTLGHARHHYCVYASQDEYLFSGDSFGASYPIMHQQPTEMPLIFPLTAPNQFDPQDALDTIDHIFKLKPKRIYLGHFGALENITYARESLKDTLNLYNQICQQTLQILSKGNYSKLETTNKVHKLVSDNMYSLAKQKNCIFNEITYKILEGNIKLNSLGIIDYIFRKLDT